MKAILTHKELINTTVQRLKQYEPPEGYYLAFGGGKDSIVLKKLADMAGVKYDAHYNNTTIDPIELVKYIRKEHPDVIEHKPKDSFLKLLRSTNYGYPTSLRRWCCRIFKEVGGIDRLVITGIRHEESARRKGRALFESSTRYNKKTFMHPIIDWREIDVWEFIEEYKLPYCEIYDWGYDRIGCVFCPLKAAHLRRMDLIYFPKWKKPFIASFNKLYESLKVKGDRVCSVCKNGEELFYWWLDYLKNSKIMRDQKVNEESGQSIIKFKDKIINTETLNP